MEIKFIDHDGVEITITKGTNKYGNLIVTADSAMANIVDMRDRLKRLTDMVFPLLNEDKPEPEKEDEGTNTVIRVNVSAFMDDGQKISDIVREAAFKFERDVIMQLLNHQDSEEFDKDKASRHRLEKCAVFPYVGEEEDEKIAVHTRTHAN